tara:strand:- start:230 stop:736 length:507 start_codon:yes stop_codon:yes gene_type:complete
MEKELTMDDHTFDRLVSEDVKNILSAEKSDFLRIPENRERWKTALLTLIDNLEQQIGELTQNEKVATQNLPSHLVSDYKIETDEKKTKITRFRFYVMQRISECEKLLALGEEEATDLSLAEFLKRAIEEHQNLMADHEFEATPIDKALWSSVSGEWGFVDMENKINDF